MATINLGAIKFNWKGAYNNSTAYAVDDVVSSGGSSYVCILASTGNATSNGTYWEQMSSAGTNGTDLTTTLTTQGDVLYRDGSGLQRLAKGTAGKALVMNSGATAPEWGTVAGGKVLQVIASTSSASASTSSTSFVYVAGMPQANITPSATSSKILVMANFGAGEIGSGECFMSIKRDSTILSNIVGGGVAFSSMQYSSNHRKPLGSAVYLDSPSSTSQLLYQMVIHSTGTNFSFGSSNSLNLVLMEIGA